HDRNGIVTTESLEGLPSQAVTTALAAIEPFEPQLAHTLAISMQARAISSHAVVGVMPSHLLAQFCALRSKALVPISANPFADPLQGPSPPRTCGFLLDGPACFPRFSLLMFNAQQVESAAVF